MKTHTNLKELLEDFTKQLLNLPEDSRYNDFKNLIETFSSSNSLALGKPEPLAKNKQTKEVCSCNKPDSKDLTGNTWCSKCFKVYHLAN